MRKIKLTKGFDTIVDDDDYDMLCKFRWFANDDGRGHIRAMANDKGKLISMTRLIIGVKVDKGLCIDHINRNPLDNRKCNLRICTRKENNQNRSMSKKNTSGYYGVNFYKQTNRWVAKISINSKRRHLGYFNTPEEAAKAYDRECIKNRLDFSVLNFPT